MSLTVFRYRIYATLIAVLIWPLYGQSAQLSIPDYPLFLTAAGVPPNIVLTLDDSGSMARAFTPDICNGQANSFLCSILADRFAKSSTGNPVYYDPSVVYLAPPKVDGTLYSTSFTAAYINGFDPNSTTKNYGDSYYGSTTIPNLSNNYRPTAARFFSTGTSAPNGNPYGTSDHALMNHDSTDVSCQSKKCQVSNGSGGWSTTGTQACTASSDCVTKGVPAYYYVFKSTCDPSGNPNDATSDIRKDACYDIKIVGNQKGPADLNGDGTINGDDERQNFANWYSFYRVRTLTTISSTLRAFGALSTSDATKIPRIAWQALNSCASTSSPLVLGTGSASDFVTTSCRGWDSKISTVSNAIQPFSGTQKTNFYSWVTRLPSYSGTPLRSALIRVGRYFTTSGNNSPYDNDLTTSSSEEYSCRKNYHIVMTDGLWNSDTNLSIGNQDSGIPNPYADTMSNTMADIAYYFWKTDLRTNLSNTVMPSIVQYYSDAASCSPSSASFVYPPPASCKQFWDARNDPQVQQHLVNYMIGFGLSGFLKNVDLTYDRGATEPTFSGSYADLQKGTKIWPTTSADKDGNVADLWHAALNSRGKFYSADSPDDVVNAFQKILNTISAQAASGGGAKVASNFARLSEANPTAFLARFNDDWSGTLEAFPFNLDGTLGTTHYWEAGSLIPPGNGNLRISPRNIFTYLFTDINKSITSGSAKEFTTSNICASTNMLSIVLNSDSSGVLDNLCTQRVAWLRGYTAITDASWDSTKSQVTFKAPNHGLKVGNIVAVSGVTVTGSTPTALNNIYTIASIPDQDRFTATAGDPGGTYVADENDDSSNRTNDDRVIYNGFRSRSSALGDIMYSGVVYAQKEDFGYGGENIVVKGGGTYSDYVNNTKTNRKPVVYVGANDGMLHAFNAEVCTSLVNCPDSTHPDAGKELFAYIPAGIHSNLNRLSDPLYGKTHKYFVDATPTIGDAYINGSWKTYLVGGLRAGGKSIYALDISNPDNFSASNVKWEFSVSPLLIDPRYDLGLTFGQPQIGAISDTQWAVIFGNGYNSASEKAFLYIVDLSDGKLIAKIATNDQTSNGLSTPFLLDKDGDGIVDIIYAGDLQGNLWRFEKNLAGTWVLGNSGAQLFQAIVPNTSIAQAITTQPDAQVIDGKIMVFFGTGRYLEASDLTNGDTQSFYIIWDNSENTPGTVKRTALLGQTVISSTVTVGDSPYTLRTVTKNTTNDPFNRGCYLDLPTPKSGQPAERVVSSPLVKFFKSSDLEGRVIFTTATPPSDPCERSGKSWLMELSTSCGRLGGTSPFDLDQNQKFDGNDLTTIDNQKNQAVSGMKLNDEVGIVSEITYIQPADSSPMAFKILPGSTGKVQMVANSDDIEVSAGAPKRIYWEQIR